MMEIKNFDEFTDWLARQKQRTAELEEDNYNLERERLRQSNREAELKEQVYERDQLLKQVNKLVDAYYAPMAHTIVPDRLDEVTEILLAITETYNKLKNGKDFTVPKILQEKRPDSNQDEK